MVKDLTQTSNLISSPGKIAFGRLKSLKERQGTYYLAPNAMISRDSVAFRIARPETNPFHLKALAAKPEVETVSRRGWLRSIVHESAKVAIVVAATVMGGIIGGGLVGAMLGGAGASAVMALNALLNHNSDKAKVSRVLDFPVSPVVLNGTTSDSDAGTDNKTGAPVDEAASPRTSSPQEEAGRAGLKRMIMSAAIRNGVTVSNAFSGAFSAADRQKTLRFGRLSSSVLERPEDRSFGGFDGAVNRFKTAGAGRLPLMPTAYPGFEDEERDARVEAIPLHNMDAPVGVVTLDEKGARLTILEPDSERANEIRRGIKLDGRRLKNGKISNAALSEFETILQDLKQCMAEYHIEPENVRVLVSGGLRGVTDANGVPMARRLSEKTDLPVIDGRAGEEANYVYASVLRGQSRMSPRQRNLVVSLGDTETVLALGKGRRQLEQHTAIKLGTATLGIEDPSSPIDVALGRGQARLVLEGMPGDARLGRRRTVFVPGSAAMNTLAAIEMNRPEGRQDIMADGLDTELMDWYLSPVGLDYLKRQELAEAIPGQGADAYRKLVETLVILRETAERLGVGHYRVGAEGGLQSALADEAIRAQIARRAEVFGEQLHDEFAVCYPSFETQVQDVLIDFEDELTGRCKTTDSIAPKLSRKAGKTDPRERRVVLSLDDARQLIGDGLGMRLVLDDCSRGNIGRVRDALIQGIREDKLRVLQIVNYRGTGNDALPYFTAEDIERIRMAARLHQGTDVAVIDGPAVDKAASYTTTQLNIQVRHPETGHYSLASSGELQIRGTLIQDFAEIEHLLYDIRMEKDIYKGDSAIKAAFQPQVQPLLQAIQSMSEKDYRRFTDYISDLYRHFRHLENGHVVDAPKLPEGLPEVCHVDNLTRLHQNYRQLLVEKHARGK